MIQQPFITVAICTYNRERYLPQLFDSILRQTLPGNRFEVILVNNNSPGNTQEIGNEFSENNPEIHYRYFLETNQGLSHARNRCIREAHGEYITFLDDDAFIQEDYLELLLKHFEGDQTISAIGGKILLHYESIIPSWENKFLNSLMGFYDRGDTVSVYDGTKNNYPRGSNMSFKTAIFNKIGLFNPNLGRIGGNMMGGEEKDLFTRIFTLEKYKVVYFPDLVVYHSVPVERTTADFIRKQALETGKSERIRTKNEGKVFFLKRLGIEGWKWCASIILWIFYALKGQFSKGNMIVFFRWWVTKGIIQPN